MVALVGERLVACSWFVIIRDEDSVRDLAIKLIHELRQAQNDGRMLKVRVQEIEPEDTYGGAGEE